MIWKWIWENVLERKKRMIVIRGDIYIFDQVS